MRILFLIRSLNRGGAERQLVAAARGLRRRHDVSVAAFYGGGPFEDELRQAGIAVHDLRKRGRWDLLPVLSRAARLVRAEHPDVLVAYMGLANVVASALRPAFPRMKVVWGIRTAKTDLSAYDWLAKLGPVVDRVFVPFADAIVTNSHAARGVAIAGGLPERKLVVIPNGIDCEQFRPDRAAAAALRREWGIGEGAPIVGIVARLDPVKGHETYLRAAAQLTARVPSARFVCVGGGRAERREALARLAQELGVADRITWAGEMKVTRAVYSAFDVTVLSSNDGESFPNAVAEAMACACPCVVTDSGDMRSIVGDTGIVVPPRDVGALADGIAELLARATAPGNTLGANARARIERQFSVPMLVERTEQALKQVLA
jgi:glycosyltransferase involved in cell wall biosynthesis